MKSLLDLIVCSFSNHSDSSDWAPKAERIIKDEAKRYFFDGKIDNFVQFIYGEPNPEIQYIFEIQFTKIGIEDADFLLNMRKNILLEVESHHLSKDLDGLLILLGYEHLKPFISLFKK
jgi:hypothetical protein